MADCRLPRPVEINLVRCKIKFELIHLRSFAFVSRPGDKFGFSPAQLSWHWGSGEPRKTRMLWYGIQKIFYILQSEIITTSRRTSYFIILGLCWWWRFHFFSNRFYQHFMRDMIGNSFASSLRSICICILISQIIKSGHLYDFIAPGITGKFSGAVQSCRYWWHWFCRWVDRCWLSQNHLAAVWRRVVALCWQ